MPVPGLALGDHRTGGHVQGGKECGAAVADDVVGDTLDVAQTHRQQRLGAIESLDLRFHLNAEHYCLIGRVEVEPDDVSYLLDLTEALVAEIGLMPLVLQLMVELSQSQGCKDVRGSTAPRVR